MSEVQALKDLGDQALASKDFDKAISLYSQAIEIDANNQYIWSNRSAARAEKGEWESAHADAEVCLDLTDRAWAEGWVRKGAALLGQKDYDTAIACYNAATLFETTPEILQGLDSAKAAKAAAYGSLGLGKAFQAPNIMDRLSADPRTQRHMTDPSFVERVNFYRENPHLSDGVLEDGSRKMADLACVLADIDPLEHFRRNFQQGGSEQQPVNLTALFSDPDLLGKLALNPQTQSYLDDPSFIEKIKSYQEDPSTISEAIYDPRMLDVISVITGVDNIFSDYSDEDQSIGEISDETTEEDEIPDTPPPSSSLEFSSSASKDLKQDRELERGNAQEGTL